MARCVVHFSDSATFGGAEQAMLTLLEGLDRRWWRPVLFHYPEPGIAPLVDGARDVGVETQSVARMEGKRDLTRLPAFLGELHARKPAVFHAHLTWSLSCKFGLAGAAVARVPAVVATEQLFVDLPWSRWARLQHRVVSRGVDQYIAVSDHVARQVHQAFGVPLRKLSVIHNAVRVADLARSIDPALRASVTGRPDCRMILTAARLDPQKGHRYLLRAAAMVPDAVFVLAGDGPERDRLEEEARALGVEDRVVLLGHRRDVPDLLASCDLFVLPSLFEGLPLSILEAMAWGKPVVATQIGGTDEAVVAGETGLLVPPTDAYALAGAINAVLSDASLARRIGAAGKERVLKEFSAQTMVERVTNIYDELLDGSKVGDGRN